MANNIQERFAAAFYEYLAAKNPKVSRRRLREQAETLAEMAVDELAGRLGAVINNPDPEPVAYPEYEDDDLVTIDPPMEVDLQGWVGDHNVEGDNEVRD